MKILFCAYNGSSLATATETYHRDDLNEYGVVIELKNFLKHKRYRRILVEVTMDANEMNNLQDDNQLELF